MLGYLWAGPASLLGLLIAAVASRRARVAVIDGVLEIHGPALAWVLRTLTPCCGGAAAITFGHVVLGRDQRSLERTRTHERVHVRQYEQWGPLFIPAYLAAGVWAWLRGGNAYYDNRFEREALAAESEHAPAHVWPCAICRSPSQVSLLSARRSAANARAKSAAW